MLWWVVFGIIKVFCEWWVDVVRSVFVGFWELGMEDEVEVLFI